MRPPTSSSMRTASAQSPSTSIYATCLVALSVLCLSTISQVSRLWSNNALRTTPILTACAGSTILPLPPTFRLEIPSIAYKIPDLEAFAQLNLTQTETGKTVACVQSTLSNGWSTHQPAVSSATAAFAVVALLSSFVHSFFDLATSPSVFRVWDIFYLFQHIATTGMLHLNYPTVYTAFTTNFAWSVGLFTDSSVLQRAIERMRYKTGSTLPTEVQQPDEYTDRKLSPYNILALQSRPAFKEAPHMGFENLLGRREFVEPATIVTSKDTLSPGIPTYVNWLGIPTGNAFMSVFFTVLFLSLSALACAVAGHFVVRFLSRRFLKGVWYDRLPGVYRRLVLAFAIRLVSVLTLNNYVSSVASRSSSSISQLPSLPSSSGH
jgi:Transient receptor potential (TRP) ion channel/ML-like domain